MSSNQSYAIYFQKQDAKDTTLFHLPVNPEKLPVTQDSANEEYNVLGIGPIMVPRKPNLKKVTIESYFPGKIDSLTLTSGDFQPPEFYINFFRNAMRNKEVLIYTPTRYYEDGTPYFVNDPGFAVLVTNFETEERGGETGDFYYTLELTEYRDYSPLIAQIQTEATAEKSATATIEQTRSIPKGQLYVGAKAVLNGNYFYSSYGDKPYGSGNGRQVVVSRIINDDNDRAYPVHVKSESGGALGWCKKGDLQGVDTQ